jgi:hypothetical protein
MAVARISTMATVQPDLSARTGFHSLDQSRALMVDPVSIDHAGACLPTVFN